MRRRTLGLWNKLRRRSGDTERGAEMVEFAIVVVLLIALLYGIITYGLILAAQATVTQAAADAARAGIVTTTPVVTAQGQAATDVGWMNKGACLTAGPATANNPITCIATTMPCPSNANNTCLKVTVSYSYGLSPLFPVLPGLGVVTPSTISSTNVLQLSTPSQ